MSNIPILIPVKNYSQRCPGKNEILLPYIASYLEKENRCSDAIVISDSHNLINMSNDLGLKTHFEVRDENQDELTSCWNYLSTYDYESFFLCPVTQPFKSKNLFQKMENNLKSNQLDFACTISRVSNREIFYVDDSLIGRTKFIMASNNKKGAMCPESFMVDGSLYLIKTSFLKRVISSTDPNAYLWAGKFKGTINSAPFFDIDTQTDMENFIFLKSYFEKDFMESNL